MEKISGDGENLTGIYEKKTKNDAKLWETVFAPDSGVDLLFSDTPIKAMKARKRIVSKHKQMLTEGDFLRMFRVNDDLYFKVDK